MVKNLLAYGRVFRSILERCSARNLPKCMSKPLNGNCRYRRPCKPHWLTLRDQTWTKEEVRRRWRWQPYQCNDWRNRWKGRCYLDACRFYWHAWRCLYWLGWTDFKCFALNDRLWCKRSDPFLKCWMLARTYQMCKISLRCDPTAAQYGENIQRKHL